MKKLMIMAMAITLGAVLLTIDAQARHHGPGPGGPGDEDMIDERPGHHNRMMGGRCFGDPEFMKQKLGLSDEQIKKIEEINLKYQKVFLEKKEELEPKKIKLRRLLLEEKVDLGDVKDVLRDMSRIEADIRLSRIKHRIDIEKILTAEQKNRIRSEMRRKRMPDD